MLKWFDIFKVTFTVQLIPRTFSGAPSSVFRLPALGRWAPPVERGPSLESIYRVSLTVDLCEGNKIISFKNLFHHSQLGTPQKEKKIRGPCMGTCLLPIGQDGPGSAARSPEKYFRGRRFPTTTPGTTSGRRQYYVRTLRQRHRRLYQFPRL